MLEALREGLLHITDLEGYDHMLFLLALLAIYPSKDWRKVVILVTAFTIGHSATLAWVALEGPILPSNVVELIIALSIAIVGLGNIVISKKTSAFQYVFALGFGLIHGMGFASFFRMMSQKEESIVAQLFGFNVGVELGQLAVVAMVLLIQWLLVKKLGLAFSVWKFGCSLLAIIGGVGLAMGWL